jgi:tetratricopeptide (TPR) repeat protein
MRLIVSIAAMLWFFVSPAFAAHHGSETKTRPAALMAGFGNVHHPVSTSNPSAQKFFDQGLDLIYGFNHEEAARSFKHAADLDPDLAMAYWGVALAVGPNYNMDVDPAREKEAYNAIQKAISLESNASDVERAYIDALAKRFTNNPKADLKQLALNYKEAMSEVVKQYPDDLDAATLYADASMNLRPWELWTPDGKPAQGTEEIVATLESVLKRDPHHLGANHLYIHAVEASSNPQRALRAANRLAALAPASGHLVHMPSHIYYRVGAFGDSARANAWAVRADEQYFQKNGAQGAYPLMYYSHNLHFLAMSYAMEGRLQDARQAADRLSAHVVPHAKDLSMGPEMAAFVQMVLPLPTFMLMRFARWDEVLEMPRPEPASAVTDALWHFARGSAFAVKGDLEGAQSEREAFLASEHAVPANAMFGFDKTSDVIQVAHHLLDARIAIAQNDYATGIARLREAVAAEDKLAYSEPPNWYYPVRETLGGALLKNGDYALAEKVFREDLHLTPNNPRSLFGLVESLKAQGKTEDAMQVDKQFVAAWSNADSKLEVEDL